MKKHTTINISPVENGWIVTHDSGPSHCTVGTRYCFEKPADLALHIERMTEKQEKIRETE
jgi:hypothetical protein